VQVQCSQCATRIQIEDARVPDRPFKVKCPRCQAVLSLPGRGAADAASAAAPLEPPSGAPEPAVSQLPPPPPSSPASADEPPGAAALARHERLQEGQKDAIIALPGEAAAPLQQALEKLGFHVDSVQDVEEGARLLEQGVYELAVTSREPAASGRPETLAQRILRLSPDTRRRVFVVLVGAQFRTGDGVQAWAAQADLVLNPADTGRAEAFIRATMAERRRLYQPFADARRRLDAD
jgi:predicted Zn finger-like uncharacterized protein